MLVYLFISILSKLRGEESAGKGGDSSEFASVERAMKAESADKRMLKRKKIMKAWCGTGEKKGEKNERGERHGSRRPDRSRTATQQDSKGAAATAESKDTRWLVGAAREDRFNWRSSMCARMCLWAQLGRAMCVCE